MSADVIPLKPDHIEGFHAVFDVVARERRWLAFTEAPSLVDTAAFVAQGAEAGSPQFVALVAGEVVGWCDIFRMSPASRAHRGTLGMGLLPDFRGRGIGANLLAAALMAAWQASFTRVELTVFDDNPAALALYTRAGFVREGLMRDAICLDGRYRDVIAMALVRRGPSPPPCGEG